MLEIHNNRTKAWLWSTLGGISGAGMLMVYWFGGVAVGFSAGMGYLVNGLEEKCNL